MVRIADIIAGIDDSPSLEGDTAGSRLVYAALVRNFEHDVIYPEHVTAFSRYIFTKLHPECQARWVAWLTAPAAYTELSLLDSSGRLRPFYDRAKHLLDLIPEDKAHLVPQDTMMAWVGNTDPDLREAGRIMALRMAASRKRLNTGKQALRQRP